MKESTEHRRPPSFNKYAEQSAIGPCFLTPQLLEEILATAPPEIFSPELRPVAEAMRDLHEQGISLEPVKVKAELVRRGSSAEEAHLIVYGLLDVAGSSSDALHSARVVKEAAHKRSGEGIVLDLQRYTSNGAGRDHLAKVFENFATYVRDVEPAAEVVIEPLDLATELAREPEPIAFVHKPHLPATRRVWAFGAAESGKSMWAAWVACRLSRQGVDVLYISQENPLDEDLRRLRRLGVNPDHLRFVHDAGLDLALPDHVSAVTTAASGCALVVLDTISACWTGDENDNAAIAALDRDALAPIVRKTGATLLVLDHTGHPQQFTGERKGVNAGRGASAKGQKADIVLNFKTQKPGDFVLGVSKMRAGNAIRPPDVLMRVVDTDDDALDIETVGTTVDAKIAEIAEVMVEVISLATDGLTTRMLRQHDRVKVLGGSEALRDAMRLLESGEPPRVRVNEELFDTGKGRQMSKVWRPAAGGLL